MLGATTGPTATQLQEPSRGCTWLHPDGGACFAVRVAVAGLERLIGPPKVI